jgi:DNA-binding transcriptional MerR regulator
MALRIGELARLAGLSPDTIRHYERLGILPAAHRSANGYREFAPEAVARIQLVQRTLACGFTLSELAEALHRRDRGEAPCRQVRSLAAQKLARMEREAELLRERCEALGRTIRDWDRRLAHTPRGHLAHLLDHVAEVAGHRALLNPPLRNASDTAARRQTE